MSEPSAPIAGTVGVAIVAPGGYAPDDAALQRGIALLEAQGCLVRNYYRSEAKYLRFGATDSERVAQLHAAANDPDIQIVLALRGSYGASRVLPNLDFETLARSRKLFVGSSDFTAFELALLARTGATSFAGPMLCDDFTRADPSPITMNQFWACVRNPVHEVVAETEGNPTLETSGKLWGGNLAMLVHLIGSSYWPHIDQGILFVEDVNEHPYRVERMLLQLLHAGVLQRQRAILLGDFSNYRLSDYDNGYDFEGMLGYIRSRLDVPLLTGLPFGHNRNKATLVVGAHAQLISTKNALRLTMSNYQCL